MIYDRIILGDNMNFEYIIKKRTAVRKFSDKVVEKELIDKILEAGSLAPTAKNLQPQKIYVVSSSGGLEKVDNVSPCRYGAPVVLIVCADKNIAWTNNGYSSYEMDASIVATHMMLEATNLGLGSIWVRYFDEEKLKEVFNLESGVIPVCLMPIGYKDNEYTESVNHNIRKNINEYVEYI